MNASIESRLERAGRTLDRASEEYRAGRGVAPVELGELRGDPGRSSILISLAAAVLTVAIVGAVLLTVREGGGGSVTVASSDGSPGADAVSATRAVSAMAVATDHTVETSTGVSRELVESWNYGSPDRWERLAPSEFGQSLGSSAPSGVSVRLYVGSETWSAIDGRWVAERAGEGSTPTPLILLNTLAGLDCHVDVAGQIVLWTSTDAVCDTGGSTGVPKLPIGTSVWAVEVDTQGRIAQVDAGVVLDLGHDTSVDGSTKVINRVGAPAETTTRFWYDNVPEVPGRPRE